MRKLKVAGSYPDLSETARRLGMTRDDVVSVQTIASKVIAKYPTRTFSIRRKPVGDESAHSRSDQ